MEFKRALCFIPSATGFQQVASYTLDVPKGEFLKSVLLQTRPNGWWTRCNFPLIPFLLKTLTQVWFNSDRDIMQWRKLGGLEGGYKAQKTTFNLHTVNHVYYIFW